MLRLRGGPAAGAYAVKRAPYYLRAVISGNKEKDVLDQPEDTANPDESIHVYRRIGEEGIVHLNFGGSRRGSGFFATGEYEHLPDVEGEDVRDNQAWRDWCRVQAAKEEEGNATETRTDPDLP